MKFQKFILAFFSCFLYKLVSGKYCCPENHRPQQRSRMCSDELTPMILTCKRFFQLNPNIYQDDEFAHNETENKLIWGGSKAMSFSEFCVSLWPVNETAFYPKPVAFVCFPPDESKTTRPDEDSSVTLQILCTVSTLFLVLTLIIYLITAEAKDLSGKCMVAFVFSMSAFYALLVVLQSGAGTYHSEICVFLAFFMYFWSMSSFFWLNVISFHIWRSTVRKGFEIVKPNKCLAIYCCWGFGVPLLLTITSLLVENIPGGHLKPEIGTTKCWFAGPEANWCFFYGPIALLVAVNIVFFSMTSFVLFPQQTYTLSTLKKSMALKIKFILHLRLFLLMGITWIFEMISFATPDDSWFHKIWFVTDCLNSSQGIIIFLILVVFRKKVRSNTLKMCWYSSDSPPSLEETGDDVKDQSETINKFELTTVELN